MYCMEENRLHPATATESATVIRVDARPRSGREGSPNRSRDRKGALLALPIDLTLPYGRGSDWSTPCARLVSLGGGIAFSRLRHHLFDARQEFRRMVRDAVFNGPFHAAGVHGLAVADLIHAGRIEHFEILQRVSIYDDQIGGPTGSHAAQMIFLAEDFGVVAGGLLDDLERMEAGLLVQLEVAEEAEAIHLVYETGIVAHADQAAQPLELA